MKVQIIGLGVVGMAQAKLLHKLNHNIYAYDVIEKNPPEYIKFLTKPCSNVDINFICTPENSLEKVIQMLIKDHVKGLYIIKSTTAPGETKKLSEKYNIHICHNPEFLREKYAFYDAINPSRIIIGQCCPRHGQLLKQLYEPLNRPIYITDPTTSELVKITSNSLRATIITFWNEINQLSSSLHLNIKEIASLVDQVNTIGFWEGGNWGTKFFGKKYDGKCLPKDVDHIINTFQEHNLITFLFKSVKESNNRFSE